MKNRLFRSLALLLLACLPALTACNKGDEVNNTYCNLRARLTIENVQQAPVLFTACNSMDQYCKITSDGMRFNFVDAVGKSSAINISAISGYGGYYLGLSGFIVGLPSIPEMGQMQSRVVCYDLACSNCYHQYTITKPLELDTSGYAYCRNCQRTYNLSSGGMVSKGPSGRNLYRYRVSFVGNALVINNG